MAVLWLGLRVIYKPCINFETLVGPSYCVHDLMQKTEQLLHLSSIHHVCKHTTCLFGSSYYTYDHICTREQLLHLSSISCVYEHTTCPFLKPQAIIRPRFWNHLGMQHNKQSLVVISTALAGLCSPKFGWDEGPLLRKE